MCDECEFHSHGVMFFILLAWRGRSAASYTVGFAAVAPVAPVAWGSRYIPYK